MTDPLMSHRTNGGGGGYSSAGLTWPRRVRPSSLSFRPLRSVNPGQSPEGNMDPSQSFLSPPIQQRSGYVSPLRAVRTLKEYDQEIDGLRKENFNLKLNLYFLERDMEKMTNPQEREVLKVNVQLKIEAETLKSEITNKAAMLHEAMIALEKQEQKHTLEIQHSKESQMLLETQMEALKQELEKERMQTPRSSEPGSEIYRQAFGMEESLSGKSSPEYEMSWEQMKSQYLSELEKMRCTIDEKDKEIKNMRTVIEDLEEKNKVLEEKVRKRNVAIQGLLRAAKMQEDVDVHDPQQGSLQKSLTQAIEAAHTGNRDSVVSNMLNIRKGLSELLSPSGSEVALNPSDVEHLKNEISRKDEVIQALEEQLIDRTRRVRYLEENTNESWSPAESGKVLPISSNSVLEQECGRLQKAVREKDHFIQELLDERAKMTSEHEKTVQSLVSRLQNQSEHESGKIKDSDIYDSESLKMLQELICEKDAEIDVRKKTIELLNFQLAKCQSELQAAITNNEEKECKLLELSSRSMDLENQLKELQLEMRALKVANQNRERLSTSNSLGSEKCDPSSGSAEISKPLIDFDDSLKSASVPEKKHASLSEIKELQKSLEESMPASGSENVEFHGQRPCSRGFWIDVSPNVPGGPAHSSSAQQPSLVWNKEISDSICVRTPKNETIRLSFNVSKKSPDAEKSEELLDIMENNIEEFERQKLLQQLENKNNEIVKLGRHATLQEDMTSVLAEDKKRLQRKVEDKTSEVQMLTVSCSQLENQVISLQSQLHSAAIRADELERIVHDSKSKPKTPVPKSSAASQTDTRKIFTQESECNTVFSDFESNLTSFGQSDEVNALKGEICILTLMVEEKDKEIFLHKRSIKKLESELKNMTALSGNTSQLISGYSEGISAVHHQLSESQSINNNLLHHLQDVARFMESLLDSKGKQKLDVSSLTPENVGHVIKHISDSIELSENLSQNLTMCEESRIFDPDEYSRVINESMGYPQSELFKSGRISVGTDEDFMTSSRRIESEGSFRRDVMEPKLDILVESRLLALERSIEDKLAYVQSLSQAVQDDISGLTKLAEKSPDQTHTLLNINEEINNLQSTLANAVEEVKVLKDTTQESSHLSQDRSVPVEELRLYNEEILSKIDDIDQMKEILIRERCARESAEQNLYKCHRELSDVKKKLCEAIQKLQEKSQLMHDQELVSKKNVQVQAQEVGHIPEKSENVHTPADVDHLRKSLAQEEERNVFLSKQVNDILNENKKLKIESEHLQFGLMNEQKNLEEIRQQLMSEQDMVKRLSKEKNATESKSMDLSAAVVRMKASLTELQDQNESLNKQIGNLLSENKKMKLEVEESQTQLSSEHEHLEKLNKDHLHKQESLRQLTKDKLTAENKIANLAGEVENLKLALSQKEDQSSSLNKQLTDLRNDNWRIKKEMEQLELRLRTEVEHLEAVRKAKTDLHQQNMDLITEKGDLEKRLHYSEERLKVLADEKTDLSNQIFEEQRESKDLFDRVKVLENQKAVLEKDISKYKSEIHSSDSVCDETKLDLKQTKEKLKKLELKLRQCENELSRVTTSNEHLLTDKKSLSEDLESLSSKIVELSKQHGETKKMLKERTISYNEIEREKSLLVDQIESLKVKKIQAESSRDKLISDYDSLAMKVDSLERQLKDSDVSYQKNKDEQGHLKQQAATLQNKIKLKESIVKDLEEQHDDLHEQLKDLQHSLNKNDIYLKHLEEDNHSLELQILTLQKQLKKTTSNLEVKDGEISHFQEDIFNLEQKIKDKETAQKRILEEKKASEEQILHLQQEIKKQDSFHKQLKLHSQELETQVYGLEQQLQSKELLRRKSEEEVKALQARVEEKEKSAKKLESSLKKMEHKLSAFQDSNVQLQQKVQLTETARKFSEDQTAVFREELNKLREAMLVKARKEEPASTHRLSTVIDQLNEKEEYCKALENKVIEYQKQVLKLQREYDRATTPVAQFSETGVMSADRIATPLIPSKVFSEPRSSQDYRHHSESKAQGEQENLIKGLQLDNSDLQHQIEVLEKKFNMAEKVKRDLEEENLSLWKTLYGSQDEKTDIIKTLEVKNNDLKNQVGDLEEKLESYEKVQKELEEEKNSLWQTLYGKEDEETDMIKRLEQKKKEYKDQLESFQAKLKESEVSKENLREEKDTLWKTIHGKKDEKTEIIRTLQLKNNEFKGEVEDFKKKLNACEKAKCDFEEEKNSLWKALYGKHDEKTDVTKMLELKNNELKVGIEVLERKLSHCEKAKSDIEEKKDTLWKTLYGSQDEKTEAMKMMEERNNDLRNQITILETKLSDADKTRAELEEEKNSMWKTICGSEDEKTELLQQMEMKNMDLKGEIETLKRELISREKSHKEMEEEKSSLWKTLYGSDHEKSDIIRSLEVKNNELKGQVHIFEKKFDASEKVKKDLEERVNSLRVTLYGSQDEKADAVRNIELKNNDLLAEVEHLKETLSDLEKVKNEVEDEKASLWRTLCGNEDEKTDVMRRMEQKNNDLSDQIEILEKKLTESEKTFKEMEDEKNSLWKTLYGSEHEKSDMIRRLEQKNKDLNGQVGELKKKLGDSEKTQINLEEEKNSLWMALHGSDDEKTHEIKSLEMKNTGLKGQLDILERKLSVSEKVKNEFEEEKNSLWKNMYGSQDEKAAAIKKLTMETSDLRSIVKNVENKLFDSEKAQSDLQAEKNSLSEKLNKSIEDNANVTNKLQLKDGDLKSQIEMLEEKLRVSEELKKAIEEDRNSLYNQLLGDSSGTKLEGMLKETRIYVDQVKKLEQEIVQKNTLLTDMKEKLFLSENSLTTQKNIVEHMKKEISNCKIQLEKAHTEREWFQEQYIDSQREVIRATHPAVGSEVREEDMVVVHRENADLKDQVTELLSQLHEKDTSLALPPVRTELFAMKLPTLPDEKAESSVDRKHSSEMKRAEMEKLHIEKNYLQKVLTDLKKKVESQPLQHPEREAQPEKMPTQKQQSDFSEDIAKQLAYHGLPDAALREEMRGLESERDYFKNLVDKLQTELQQYTLSLRDKGPTSYVEAENAKLRAENTDLKSKLVQMHSRVKKRESMIKALSSKVVELSQSLKESKVTSEREVSDAEKEIDSVSLLASQIVEGTSKTAEKSLSEEIVLPDIDSFGLDYEEDTQLLSLLHPSLRHSVTSESETGDLDAKRAQKLRYQIEELENQLEDTKMDNFRLQEEVNTLLLKFGIQNNKLVCEKCGKSADITSTRPSVGAKAVSKFTSFRRYLEKDPMFTKEESINKLGECKWKLQNEVLNMQKKLCVTKPSYLEDQTSFNNHVARIMATEYPKIPVRIFSEPLLSSAESKDVVKNAQHLDLLWKNQVLHLERDIRCLQNYRMFLEQFVLGLTKELTEARKEKPAILSRYVGFAEEKSQTPGVKVPGNTISKSPLQAQGVIASNEFEPGEKSVSLHSLTFTPENGIIPHKPISSQDQLLKDLPTDRPVPSENILKATSSAHADIRRSLIPEQTSSVPVLSTDMSVVEKPARTGQTTPTVEVTDLQNKIKELDKKIEGLQSENKRLQAENKMISLECKKCYRSKHREERQFEKQIEDLKHSLKDMTSLNKSLELELDVYQQMMRGDGSRDKPSEKHLDGYVKKSYVMNVLDKMKSLHSELERLTQENSMLRKKLMQLSSPAGKAVKSRVLLREESSSDKESEGTVTLSRSGSLSSLDSAHRYEMRPKKYERSPKQHIVASRHSQAPWDLPDLHFDEEHLPMTTPQRREKYDSIQETAFHRSHFSSPDLGIESDPNHELFLSEQAESDEKSYVKSRPPKQPFSPARTKPGVPTAGTVAAMWDSVKTAVAEGTSLHAVGPLKDYTLLKKEIEESLVLIKGMATRAQQCVEYLSRGAHPNKNLGYTTVKDILSSLSDINVCQVKAQQLVRSFWVSSMPPAGENYGDVASLLRENEELLKRLKVLMEERKSQKSELEQAFARLRDAQDSKQKMEKAIAKQLTRTKKVLKSAKTNLQGTEERLGASSYIPQKKNNPSLNKPSAK